MRLYIIWNEWKPISQLERSEIISDAYAEMHSTDDLSHMILAMGLTPEEAQHKGIEYTPSPVVS